ncbi:hypothetical protein UCRNP2_1695 [Neofusicoccum parvum UCRNP2]|uniref:Uncharacterized protein n=1 Tax=Botryosphaeria parva (strain UCR-NP2) TaxID=1287680 RepID=R1GIN1_BOTPV|nr:hypothetical protein UCRNP2_1695 [Neofusicoccum parvum UCRNP2]
MAGTDEHLCYPDSISVLYGFDFSIVKDSACLFEYSRGEFNILRKIRDLAVRVRDKFEVPVQVVGKPKAEACNLNR